VNHATIEPALLDWAAALTGVERACCHWQNAPRVRHNGQLVLLSWVSNVQVGVDATDYAYAANEDPLLEMTPTVTGNRLAVLQLDVEVHAQTPGANAAAIIDRARTRLRFPSALAMLEAAGLALASAEPAQTTDYKVDGRFVSRGTMDIRLKALSTETDSAGATSYIATVSTAATVTDPAGDEVAASIQPGGSL
jgi:hypothetical protein